MWSQRDASLRKSGTGNLFVKNLHPGVTHKDLYDAFSLFGNVLSCKVAVANDGKSKGYGYVHYEAEEAAKEAMAKMEDLSIMDQKVHARVYVCVHARARSCVLSTECLSFVWSGVLCVTCVSIPTPIHPRTHMHTTL